MRLERILSKHVGYFQSAAREKHRGPLAKHGCGTAIVMDLEAYEALLGMILVLRDLHVAVGQIGGVEPIPHEQIVTELHGGFSD